MTHSALERIGYSALIVRVVSCVLLILASLKVFNDIFGDFRLAVWSISLVCFILSILCSLFVRQKLRNYQ